MREYTVGSEVIHRIWGKGQVVGDYTDCGRPEYREVMFKDRQMGGKVSVTLSLDEIERECYAALTCPDIDDDAAVDQLLDRVRAWPSAPPCPHCGGTGITPA